MTGAIADLLHHLPADAILRLLVFLDRPRHRLENIARTLVIGRNPELLGQHDHIAFDIVDQRRSAVAPLEHQPLHIGEPPLPGRAIEIERVFVDLVAALEDRLLRLDLDASLLRRHQVDSFTARACVRRITSQASRVNALSATKACSAVHGSSLTNASHNTPLITSARIAGNG